LELFKYNLTKIIVYYIISDRNASL
jgi:hypothetical protein